MPSRTKLVFVEGNYGNGEQTQKVGLVERFWQHQLASQSEHWSHLKEAEVERVTVQPRETLSENERKALEWDDELEQGYEARVLGR